MGNNGHLDDLRTPRGWRTTRLGVVAGWPIGTCAMAAALGCYRHMDLLDYTLLSMITITIIVHHHQKETPAVAPPLW